MSQDGLAEPLKYQVLVLKVLIHCPRCTSEIKKILHKIDGVYKTFIDPQQHKVTVIGDVAVEVLIEKLTKVGKRPELWPEEKKTKTQPKNEKITKTNNEDKDKESSKTNTSINVENVDDKETKEETKPEEENDKTTETPKSNGEEKRKEKPQQKGNKKKKFPEKENKDGGEGAQVDVAPPPEQQKQQYFPVPAFFPVNYSMSMTPPVPGYWCYIPCTPPPPPLPSPEQMVMKYHEPLYDIVPNWCVYNGGRSYTVFSDENVAACRIM